MIKYLQLNLGYPGGPKVITRVPTQEEQESPGQRKGRVTMGQRHKDRLEDATQLALKMEEGDLELPGKDKETATPLEEVATPSRRNAALRTHLRTSDLKTPKE